METPLLRGNKIAQDYKYLGQLYYYKIQKTLHINIEAYVEINGFYRAMKKLSRIQEIVINQKIVILCIY